ncbi:MAG TPA: efflux RND transporter periplasmic adaptor subunit [Polyangiaceae bacterium]|nr:efflux RND transporter periplasmic adaptor subunit [Polyangiaceae bacterium]
MKRLLLSLSLVLSLAACERAEVEPIASPPPVTVQVDRARLVGSSSAEQAVGTVRARNSASISPTVMGRVVEIPVKLGQQVRAGDMLARISADEISAKAAQARALQANAQLELERAKTLLADDAIPRAQYDTVKSQFDVASAAVAEANAMVAHTVVRAPFAGVVTSKSANAGDTVVPGQPLLVLDDPTALRFEAPLAEASARAVSIGQKVTVRVDGLEGDLTGTVAEISPAAEPTSRTVLVKVDLPNDSRLHPGLFGRLSIVSYASKSLAVPSSAVLRRGQLEEVFVIDGNVARLRLIKTGHELGGSTEILSGLADGEMVAISDVGQLTDGAPVKVSP